MAANKSRITPDNIDEWMASTGIQFPRTILELKRFEKLHADIAINLEGCLVDPEVILGLKNRPDVISISVEIVNKPEIRFSMAARKGGSNIRQSILDKIKLNQEKRKQDDRGSKKEGS